mgnify:CR=1 FL=1
MKKKSFIPQTKVKNPEPKKKDDNWVIWAAWADRITFEEIKDKTGKTESDVIELMTTYVILDFTTLMIYGFAAHKVSACLKHNPKTLNTISACVLLIIALYVAITQSY